MIRLSNCTSQLMRLRGTNLAAKRFPSAFKFSHFGKMAGRKSRGAGGESTNPRNNDTNWEAGDFPSLSDSMKQRSGGKPLSQRKSKEGLCNNIAASITNPPNPLGEASHERRELLEKVVNVSSSKSVDSTGPESREPNDGVMKVEEGQKESSSYVTRNQQYDTELPDDFGKKQTPYNPRETVDEPTDSKIKKSIQYDGTELPDSFGKKPTPYKPPKPIQKASRGRQEWANKNTKFPSNETLDEPFNICFPDRIRKSKSGQVLRPGMVLFKNYLPVSKQVDIVSKCYELGGGKGGKVFYRPGYKDGGKLRLHMMCLGLDWDPQTRKYGKKRIHDDASPPKIPSEFAFLVENVLNDSHELIEREMKVADVEDVLPKMSPDLCIVNFYNSTGRLGLHQDRDESWESLDKGLPVVSISIGDSADFLYSDYRDPEKAECVVLESGDVLVFGGESRHVFHGVSRVYPRTAPRSLLEDAALRPGRLNLTFRKN